MTSYTNEEKIEVIEQVIEQWRSAGRHGSARDRAIFLILKSIAIDYRAREPFRVAEIIQRMERAIEHAENRKQRIHGYEQGNLREIAELFLGSWPAWRQAMVDFLETTGVET